MKQNEDLNHRPSGYELAQLSNQQKTPGTIL